MFNKSNLYIYIWERIVDRRSFNDRVRIGGCEIGLAVLVEWASSQETKKKEKGHKGAEALSSSRGKARATGGDWDPSPDTPHQREREREEGAMAGRRRATAKPRPWLWRKAREREEKRETEKERSGGLWPAATPVPPYAASHCLDQRRERDRRIKWNQTV